MNYLIDANAQAEIAALIDSAVAQVLAGLTSHGSEEALTSALGHALMQRKIQTPELTVNLRYRQHNKITEEPHSGADGAFLVRVVTPGSIVEKAALFQAKLIRGRSDVRNLSMSKVEVERLVRQTSAMLHHTEDAVAVFYTWKNIYVVDASDYQTAVNFGVKKPLSQKHRLITLGTYLGKWLPRCTKGDQREEIVTRARNQSGFRNGFTLDVVSQQPSVLWEDDKDEKAWSRSYKKRP